MTHRADDTFATFVDALAETLDDQDTTPAQLAARVHLSRYHLDRIVKSASGEPAARLRRRVLLERAAYRLPVADRNLLDEAIDAGYASHEAFTRAFERAYGAPPSAWRTRPTNFQIDAPSGVHFHPPAGLRLPPGRQERSMDLVVRMVEHHIWLIGEIAARAARLSDEQLDTALPRRMN